MDAYHYDKIADKLIQFHSKLPNEDDLTVEAAKSAIHQMKQRIEFLLKHIDYLANADDRGWIR